MSIESLNAPVRDSYDFLIVGGGIYGAAVAYETARRGHSALLVERHDFGASTSFNSMKIIHGGLRYLQDLDFGRVAKSRRELRRLLGIAPHRVRPLHCELKVESRGSVFRAKFRVGLLVHAALSRLAGLGLGDRPNLPQTKYPCWYDGLVDDTEQFLLEFLHTAVRISEERVTLRNYSPVEEYVRYDGRIVAARISGLGEIRIGRVIECIGAHRQGADVAVSMNLVVNHLRLADSGRAIGLCHPFDKRFVFVVPWRNRCIVGTYDLPYPHDPCGQFKMDRRWVDEFLSWLEPVHPELAALTPASVKFVHAGLLRKDDDGGDRLATKDRVLLLDDGRVSVQGVKYTTARAVAEEAVGLAAREAGLRPPSESMLHEYPTLSDRRKIVGRFSRRDPSLERPVVEGETNVTRGEIVYSLEHEQARGLDDVLLRRSSIANAGHPGKRVVDATATILQQQFGWSEIEQHRQVESFENDYHFKRGFIPSGG